MGLARAAPGRDKGALTNSGSGSVTIGEDPSTGVTISCLIRPAAGVTYRVWSASGRRGWSVLMELLTVNASICVLTDAVPLAMRSARVVAR